MSNPAASESAVSKPERWTGPLLRPVRVGLLFVSPMMRIGCAAMVNATEDFEVVFEGGPEDHATLGDQDCDIVIVGITRHNDWGAYALQALATRGECVLAVISPAIHASAAVALGAHACIESIDADQAALESLLLRLVRGEVVPAPPAPPALNEVGVISPRERQVLEQLAMGRTDREIATALGISVRTVQSHLDRIREKTHRRRRAELTVLAFELGIAPRPGAS